MLKEIPYLGYVITWEGIKPDPKKLKRIVDLWRPTTTTEVQALIGVFQYYMNMWPRQYHILAPLTKEISDPNGRKIICNDALE